MYETIQLGASMPDSNAHYDNAKIIKNIPNDQIKYVTYADLVNFGIRVGAKRG